MLRLAIMRALYVLSEFPLVACTLVKCSGPDVTSSPCRHVGSRAWVAGKSLRGRCQWSLAWCGGTYKLWKGWGHQVWDPQACCVCKWRKGKSSKQTCSSSRYYVNHLPKSNCSFSYQTFPQPWLPYGLLGVDMQHNHFFSCPQCGTVWGLKMWDL